jgi:hypothetical protein
MRDRKVGFANILAERWHKVLYSGEAESKRLELSASSTLRGGTAMAFDEAINFASRDERFKATIYAMNSLLIHKGVYTQAEFQRLFTEWFQKEENKKAAASVLSGGLIDDRQT